MGVILAHAGAQGEGFGRARLRIGRALAIGDALADAFHQRHEPIERARATERPGCERHDRFVRRGERRDAQKVAGRKQLALVAHHPHRPAGYRLRPRP